MIQGAGNNTVVPDPLEGAFNDVSQSGLAQQIDEAGERRWAEHAEAVIMDPTSTFEEVSKVILDSMEGGQLSQFRMMFLQRLVSLSNQMQEFLTNLMQTMDRARQAVIRNVSS